MASEYDLQALRRRIDGLTAANPKKPSPAISLGDGVIDSALPDHGLAAGALHELHPAHYGDFAAALGFGLGLLTRLTLIRPGPVLWALPAHEASRHGMTYPPGLAAFGFDPDRLSHLKVSTTQEVLWALEQGLASTGLAAVVGIVPANGRFYDFTASLRLSMRAAQSGVTALLIRRHADIDNATAAATRWVVASQPSAPMRRSGSSMPGLGPPCWRINLVRCKRGRPHEWLVEWDHETLSFHLVAPLADRAAALAG